MCNLSALSAELSRQSLSFTGFAAFILLSCGTTVIIAKTGNIFGVYLTGPIFSCIEVRDVETQRPVYVPLNIHFRPDFDTEEHVMQ